MKEQKTMLLHKVEETIQTTRGEMYARLAGKPVTRENLAAAIQPYFPEKTMEELCLAVTLLEEGMQAGAQQFDDYEAMSDEQLDDVYSVELENNLNKLDASRQRQYLLTLAQILLQDSELPVNSRLALYLSRLSLPALKVRVVDLLKEKSQESAKEVLSLMQETGEDIVEAAPVEADPAYTGAQKDLIEAVTVYAASQITNMQIGNVAQIGKQVGFVRRMARTAMNWIKLNKTALLVRLGMLIAAAAAVALLLALMAEFGGVIVVMGMLEKLIGKHMLVTGAVFVLKYIEEQMYQPLVRNFPFHSVQMEQNIKLTGMEELYIQLQTEAAENVRDESLDAPVEAMDDYAHHTGDHETDHAHHAHHDTADQNA